MSVTGLFKKLRDLVKRNFHALMQIHDTPHAIAGGIGIGIFIGFTPLFIPFVPLKTLLSVLVSWIFRCSKVAAVIAVAGHDVIFPIWPLVLRWEYQIGYWLLHHRLPPGLHARHHHLSFQHWFSMEAFHGWSQWVHERMNWAFFAAVIGPMLLGSVIIGVPVAAVCYAISIRVVKRYQAARSGDGEMTSI